MMIEALHASGLPEDDPAYKRALKFIERCQMSGNTNDQPFARGATDGGFIYSPADGGQSKADTYDDNGTKRLRSYGSMTYAGFKSLLYAQVSRTDPRVQQAWDWIRRHYTLKENPNMPGAKSIQGLYYYYHVFAKALAAWERTRRHRRQGHRAQLAARPDRGTEGSPAQGWHLGQHRRPLARGPGQPGHRLLRSRIAGSNEITHEGVSMPTGRIKWFDPKQGFGYIIADAGGPDVFVHHTELKCSPPPDDGQPVQFDVKPSPKGPIAIAVQHLPHEEHS